MPHLSPLIVSSGHPQVVLGGLTPGAQVRFEVVPLRDKTQRREHSAQADANGELAVTLGTDPGGDTLIELLGVDGAEKTPLHAFVTSPELAGRLPLRCDLHVHTTWSDGKNTVEEMVQRAQALGLDVIAITDHNQHGGSLEAIDYAAKAGLPLLIFRGEEISSSSWHLLAIGASERIGVGEGRNTPEGIYPTLERVHALGGHGFLAHPYWKTSGTHHLVSAHYEQLLESGELDGIELFGDVDWSDNLRSLARYLALDPSRRPPILANSDTHAVGHTFGQLYTLVWARERSCEAVLEAITEKFAVACMFTPSGELLPAGPFELVDLAFFLHTNRVP